MFKRDVFHKNRFSQTFLDQLKYSIILFKNILAIPKKINSLLNSQKFLKKPKIASNAYYC